MVVWGERAAFLGTLNGGPSIHDNVKELSTLSKNRLGNVSGFARFVNANRI